MGLYRYWMSCAHGTKAYCRICEPARPAATPLTQSGNPNPGRFTVKRTERVGNYLIAEVVYPDCSNYEGRKILAFIGVDEEWLKRQRRLDPHFDPESQLVARFTPGPLGWELARRLCGTYLGKGK
jgi:hypothetical protein